MDESPIQIKRYPNRRYYARHESRYVSLRDIEKMIESGRRVEITDSQSGEDITRVVLTQIIMDRQPEKMQMFPVDMLHYIVRANDMTSDFLRDYFRHSLTYLNYLHQHGSGTSLTQPMHWAKAWLDGLSRDGSPPEPGDSDSVPPTEEPRSQDPGAATELANRIEQLETRLRQLEGRGAELESANGDSHGNDDVND